MLDNTPKQGAGWVKSPALPRPALPQEAALQALHRTEALAAAPAPRMLAFAAGSLLPRLTVSTNFYPLQKVGVGFGELLLSLCIPSACSLLPVFRAFPNMTPMQPLDLGLGILPLYDREQTFPLAKGMVVIRAAQDGGLLVQLTLPPKAARRLRGHAALAQLLPGARWAGEAGAAAVNGKSSG